MNTEIRIRDITREQYIALMDYMLTAGYYGRACIRTEEGNEKDYR